MIAVHLKELKFHAYHGLYAGEEKTGGPFEVNLSVWYQPVGLIETVAEDICAQLKQRFAVISKIELSIDKCSPPIENFSGKTGITMYKTF
jgi:dihydroneopterin aldolase